MGRQAVGTAFGNVLATFGRPIWGMGFPGICSDVKGDVHSPSQVDQHRRIDAARWGLGVAGEGGPHRLDRDVTQTRSRHRNVHGASQPESISQCWTDLPAVVESRSRTIPDIVGRQHQFLSAYDGRPDPTDDSIRRKYGRFHWPDIRAPPQPDILSDPSSQVSAPMLPASLSITMFGSTVSQPIAWARAGEEIGANPADRFAARGTLAGQRQRMTFAERGQIPQQAVDSALDCVPALGIAKTSSRRPSTPAPTRRRGVHQPRPR